MSFKAWVHQFRVTNLSFSLFLDTLHIIRLPELKLTEHRGMHLYYWTMSMRMFVWRTDVAVLPFRKGWSSSYSSTKKLNYAILQYCAPSIIAVAYLDADKLCRNYSI